MFPLLPTILQLEWWIYTFKNESILKRCIFVWMTRNHCNAFNMITQTKTWIISNKLFEAAIYSSREPTVRNHSLSDFRTLQFCSPYLGWLASLSFWVQGHQRFKAGVVRDLWTMWALWELVCHGIGFNSHSRFKNVLFSKLTSSSGSLLQFSYPVFLFVCLRAS